MCKKLLPKIKYFADLDDKEDFSSILPSFPLWDNLLFSRLFASESPRKKSKGWHIQFQPSIYNRSTKQPTPFMVQAGRSRTIPAKKSACQGSIRASSYGDHWLPMFVWCLHWDKAPVGNPVLSCTDRASLDVSSSWDIFWLKELHTWSQMPARYQLLVHAGGGTKTV